jgi:hypothetical protein
MCRDFAEMGGGVWCGAGLALRWRWRRRKGVLFDVGENENSIPPALSVMHYRRFFQK